jgi:hypothetical protein
MSGVVDAIFGGGQSAPDPNPGMTAAAQSSVDVANIQKQTAQDYLDFSKQQYEEMKPYAQKISDEMVAASQQDRDIASSQEKRAQDYYNYEQSTFRPLQEQAVQNAKDYNTDAKSEELARRSVADTEQAYSAQRQQALDTLASYGINPNSGRFASINARLNQAEAADKAGAATNARTNAEATKYGRMVDAINMGNGLAGNATAAAGTAINANSGSVGAGSAAYGIAANPGTAYGQSFSNASNIYGNANSAYGTAGNIYGSIYQGQMQAYGANQQAQGAMMGAIGNIGARYAFGKADGGKIHHGKGAVRGPGGPVDDKVPAMLSNGEYVLPADTTAAIGTDKLDKLVKATHTPAAVQRRQALQGRGA